ncbi:MAG: HD domain-containing protein [Candidatus Pelethousia sp.]|nr:HD domain-containing protein [Candidatus Pelethousia sp.]
MMKRNRFRTTISLPIVLGLAFIIMIVGLSITLYENITYRKVIDQVIKIRLSSAIQVMDNILDDYKSHAKFVARELANNPTIVFDIEDGDATSLRKEARRIVSGLDTGVDFVTITDAQGTVLARTHSEVTGDSLLGNHPTKNALAGNEGDGFATGHIIKLGMMTCVPVFDINGNIVGTVTTGFSLSDGAFINKMKEMTANDFSVFLGNECVSTTTTSSHYLAQGEQSNSVDLNSVLETGNTLITKIRLDSEYYAAYTPIRGWDGNVIGILATSIPMAEINGVVSQMNAKIHIFVLFFILLFSLIGSAYLHRFIIKPIQSLSVFASAVAEGAWSRELLYKSKNEIGIIADTMRLLVAKLIVNIEERDKEITRRVNEITRTKKATIMVLASIAESRDNETGIHLQRTQLYIKELAEYMSKMDPYKETLNPERIRTIILASVLHDIGKVGIPDHILLKPGALSDMEYDIMKSHTVIGYHALLYAAKHISDTDNLLTCASKIVHSHHEKWDGSGYPKGLSGKDIPLVARMMAVADAYDAITTRRPYKKPLTHEDAVASITADSGKHFDPDVVSAFLAIQVKFQEIREKYADEI